MKRIILQQKAELNQLLSVSYQERFSCEDVSQYVETPVIKLITGPRRAGKSTFALQMLSGTNFAYLNFDDSRLLENFDEDAVLQALSEVYPGYLGHNRVKCQIAFK